MNIREHVALAPKTTLELGGDAAHFVLAEDDESVARALAWADGRGLRVAILGGGSNLVVADAGFDGLVVEMAQLGTETTIEGDRAIVTAAAGVDWDTFVAWSVERSYQGLECLGGIPGRVGATPIQNVGAYGQDVAETIRSVRVLNRASRSIESIANDDCAFAYRNSRFKASPEEYVVLGVTFELTIDGAPAVRYAELERALAGLESPGLRTVCQTVISLRRKKSMVIDPSDPNRRSAGSFFTNPIVSTSTAGRVFEIAVEQGMVETSSDVPRWSVEGGLVKLAAGWLIERAGIAKGTRRNHVGISTKHTLALVHHGGGTTAELLALAEEVKAAVRDRFGIELRREPRLLA